MLPRCRQITLALLVQENIPVDATWTRDAFERTLRELTDLSVKDRGQRLRRGVARRSTAQGKVDLIVWPESPAPFFTNDPLFRDPVSEMARDDAQLGGDGRDREHACHARAASPLRRFSTRPRWSVLRVIGPRVTTKCIWCLSENICRSRGCSRLPED